MLLTQFAVVVVRSELARLCHTFLCSDSLYPLLLRPQTRAHVAKVRTRGQSVIHIAAS